MRFVDKYNRNDMSACMWEANINDAKVFVCTLDIESDLEQRIVAQQLNSSIFSYLQSEHFSPRFSCGPRAILGVVPNFRNGSRSSPKELIRGQIQILKTFSFDTSTYSMCSNAAE